MNVVERCQVDLEELGLRPGVVISAVLAKKPHAASVLESRLDAAAKKEAPYADFLADLLRIEVVARDDAGRAKRLHHARLPFLRTLESFDFGFQPSVDKRLVKELGTLSFIAGGQNLLLGPPGVGKTHLAVGLCDTAIARGESVLFVRAGQLMEDLRRAQALNRLEHRLRYYAKPKLLVIDEFGVWPYDRLAANALFGLIAARYEWGSVILTSNRGFADWGDVLGDPVVASAVLDRLLHHSHVLNIKGESYRLREKKKSGLFPSALVGIKPTRQEVTTK